MSGLTEEGKVSTIIPSFNRAHLIGQAVESVMTQDYPNLEVIVVDDGSTDNTQGVLQALANRYSQRFRSIRIDNSGPGPAREAGRQLAGGEFIQYLDSDDLLLPRKFELQVAALRARPDCDVAYGLTRLVDAQGAILAAPFKWTGQIRASLFPGLLVDRWWCTHTPLYRRSLTDRIGPWSDLRYSQDWEYDARAGSLGVQLAYCPEYVSEHTHHSEVRQTSGGKWLSPEQRVRFFALMLGHARKAGVSVDAPEMRHFSRWVFLNCRQVAEIGSADEAMRLLALADDASHSHSFDIRIFGIAAKAIGWQHAARIVKHVRRIVSPSPGKHTLGQSWVR